VRDGRANHRLRRIALITHFMLKVVRRGGTCSAGVVLILPSGHACSGNYAIRCADLEGLYRDCYTDGPIDTMWNRLERPVQPRG
jgi:hypothetical protein